MTLSRNMEKLEEIRNEMDKVLNILEKTETEIFALIDDSGESINPEFIREIMISDIRQIRDSRTRERAVYYINRFLRNLLEPEFSRVNDINLSRWKLYSDIITDSLWIFKKRDSSGPHNASYWGNFVPQIPYQLLRRYTKAGDTVIDGFLGSGTTLIECKKLGRNGIGIEISSDVANMAMENIAKAGQTGDNFQEIAVGDSQTYDISGILASHEVSRAQLIILHPPYWDIIRFGSSQDDLSNAPDESAFLNMLTKVVNNLSRFLEKNRYLALVIGDKYSKGTWIPLGFHSMDKVIDSGFTLKSIVVKNFDVTKGKREQKDLWRYRALKGGFYVFKHEYIFIFQKK